MRGLLLPIVWLREIEIVAELSAQDGVTKYSSFGTQRTSIR